MPALSFNPRVEPQRYVVYRWLTSDEGFLIGALVPNASVIEASPDHVAEDILRLLPERIAAFHFHLNCTFTSRFPTGRGRLLEALRLAGIPTVNASVTDISKRYIHRTLSSLDLCSAEASRDGDRDEWLFVKTDLNFGGDSEWALEAGEREGLGIPAGSQVMWTPNHYRMMRRGEVPAEWWDDRSLVLERYVQNTRNVWYRAFVNFSALTVCEFADTSLVKKVGSSRFLRSWHLNLATDDPFRPEDGGLPGSAAEQLPLFLRAIGLDFGAVDLMTDDDGSAYIIDVNTTPAYNYPVPGLVSDLVTPFG